MTAPVQPTVVVVPCFNEEHRIDAQAFTAIAADGRVRLLFVDDGSTDCTAAVLARLATCEGIEVFTLERNAGKAEAVRRGLLVAVRAGAATVGYYDADLATPPPELQRLAETLRDRPELSGVFGSRVARLGSSIERKAMRHYLGRAYATLASMALGITVYDTQCGAKVFRVDDRFVAALAEPFRSSWAFDVELLHRLLRGTGGAAGVPVTGFLEVPLETWRDVRGSKLRLAPAAGAFLDLLAVARSRLGRARGHAAARGGTAVMAPPAARRPRGNPGSVPGRGGNRQPGGRDAVPGA